MSPSKCAKRSCQKSATRERQERERERETESTVTLASRRPPVRHRRPFSLALPLSPCLRLRYSSPAFVGYRGYPSGRRCGATAWKSERDRGGKRERERERLPDRTLDGQREKRGWVPGDVTSPPAILPGDVNRATTTTTATTGCLPDYHRRTVLRFGDPAGRKSRFACNLSKQKMSNFFLRSPGEL